MMYNKERLVRKLDSIVINHSSSCNFIVCIIKCTKAASTTISFCAHTILLITVSKNEKKSSSCNAIVCISKCSPAWSTDIF